MTEEDAAKRAVSSGGTSMARINGSREEHTDVDGRH